MKKVISESVYLLCACYLAVLLPFGLTACSSDDKPFVDNEPIAAVNGGDVVKGINVSLSDFVSDVAGTRTTYADIDGGVKVTWAEADTIGIFPNQGGQVEFPIEAGTESNQATFDGGGWALKSNSTYSAYYPYRNANGNYGNKRIQLDFTGQKQVSNGSTAHLGQYDYQATGGVKTNSEGFLNFQFKHLGALMVFNLTVPKAGFYTSLTLTSSEEVFVTKAELDISGNEPVLKPVETINTITLSLDNVKFTSNSSLLTAYLILAPIDLTQGTLKLDLNGSIHYTSTLTGHSLEAGKQYNINSSLKVPTSSQIFEVNGVSFTMVNVEGGTFLMGAPDDDSEAHDNEKPQHEVTLNSFAIGLTEVTQALWMAVMGENPSCFKGDEKPVEKVSWDNCQTFIQKLNELTGKNFRLPTEAEWEFAARGGKYSVGYRYAGSNNLDGVAWYSSNSDNTTHVVGSKLPNELGLYDMTGNVGEWCQDWYEQDYYSSSPTSNPKGPSTSTNHCRLVRGQSWDGNASFSRVSRRTIAFPDEGSNDIGLRLVLDL